MYKENKCYKCVKVTYKVTFHAEILKDLYLPFYNFCENTSSLSVVKGKLGNLKFLMTFSFYLWDRGMAETADVINMKSCSCEG